MQYTQIPTDTFKNLQLNAGILLDAFEPSDGSVTPSNIIGATTGGISFEATPTFTDFGEDIDNCPKNMMELKKLSGWEAKMSGTFVTVSPSLTKLLLGAADVLSEKVTPRNDLDTADFKDLWWVGDYSDKNETSMSASKAGFLAIHLMNSLSTGGFKIQSADEGKGQFGFEFMGHYSIEHQDTPPFEIYAKAGTGSLPA